MSLDDLASIIRELRSVSVGQKSSLSANETRTRYALIDPLLIALGWNVHDPSTVIPEYSDEHTGHKRADYALLDDDERPMLLVEAKRLGTPLTKGIDQSIGYCVATGIPYFAVTDGLHWIVYEPHRPVPLDQKIVVEFDLSGEIHTAVMRAAWLWRGNFRADSPASVPDPPTATSANYEVQVIGTRDASSIKIFEEGTTTLETLRVELGQVPPRMMRFPDGREFSVRSWVDVQGNVIEWLASTGQLSEKQCPLKGPKGGMLVDTNLIPRRGGGNPRRVQGTNLHWDGKFDAKNHARRARRILHLCGVSPDDVIVD